MEVNPISAGLRATLKLIGDKTQTRATIADELRCSLTVARERVRTLLDKGYVSIDQMDISITDKGVHALAHAPVIQKSGQVTAYGLAKKSPASKVQYEIYAPPPEMKRPSGVTEDRFIAFSLPSRVGKKLYYPDGRIEAV